MTQRRFPFFATLVVAIAVTTMISLGFWQLRRLKWKEALLARYDAAQQTPAVVPWPRAAGSVEERLYRRSMVDCRAAGALDAIAGRNDHDQPGFAVISNCQLAGGGTARIVLGWTKTPQLPVWSGGAVTGMIAPGPRLVAEPPLAGLEPNAKPDPSEIPNNHLSYAIQWFCFATAALVIYALALRKRLAAADPRG
jgi:cytochrome oxidase assembly protein ShyY1